MKRSLFIITLIISFTLMTTPAFAQKIKDLQAYKASLQEQVDLLNGELVRTEEYKQQFIDQGAADIQLQELAEWQNDLKKDIRWLEEELARVEVSR